ncbi:MAG: ABC transporter [Alphaproteobacteria bacterium]|nr:ABC transporter [Alphaproteobacteria bacterium]
MTARRFALIAAFALAVLFVSVNLIANVWLKSARIDLTQDRLYTLSDGAKDVLAGIEEPMQLTFFYSRDAGAQYPAVQAYASRVREMLGAFAARSRGRVRIIEIDPEPFTDAEDRAVQAGVEPVRPQENADPVYFGLSGANAIDDTRAIPFFDPQREPFLEYEITRLIYELENPDPVRAALITSLPMDPQAEPNPFTGQAPPPSAFAQELSRLMQVDKLPDDFTEIPSDIDVLAIIHPAPLSPQQLYAIDQFMMRKGRAFIALDPASISALRMSGQFTPEGALAPSGSNLEPLLSTWGVAMSQDVVMDLGGALEVPVTDANGQQRSAPQPLLFAIPPGQLDDKELATAWLSRGLNFGAAGALSFSEREGVTFTPLARSSADTMRLPASEVPMQPSPLDLLRGWVSNQRQETLALRVSGPLNSAYRAGPPEGAAALEGQQHLAQTAAPAEVIVVSDADFLADDLYVAPQGATFADNGAFAVNAIEMLGGAQQLIQLRSRAPSSRPMTVVDDMERQAARRMEQRQSELQNDLQAAEARLRQLQTQGRGSGYFSGDLGAELTQDEQAELERFRARVVEVRSQLRDTQRQLRSGIDQLQAWIVFLNVWLGPLIVAGVGLFLFWRRQRRPAANGSGA